ncbi:hypothetical protein RF11_12914 [Thelohanellus kitauei]|uniref:Uncharacterized protein n=1 Tax=Thelohanellus kitauei TaxID=669202 RepID=A0A0C2I8E3_THEKT|nr:hypothetical protein RF11_12914 [Thelohanellus kitauei]
MNKYDLKDEEILILDTRSIKKRIAEVVTKDIDLILFRKKFNDSVIYCDESNENDLFKPESTYIYEQNKSEISRLKSEVEQLKNELIAEKLKNNPNDQNTLEEQ